ncbi:hypothetical protein V1514DRAFT_368192 [Lipomyces japonicus]|uniref:uncharacterized protein n=1 Tax=Lipomyces japonicus TaxID=56871 RepID=UPI0034CD78B5
MDRQLSFLHLNEDYALGPVVVGQTVGKDRPFFVCSRITPDVTVSADNFSFDLAATEGTKVYVGTVQGQVVDDFRTAQNSLPDHEWKSVILWTLAAKNTFQDQKIFEKYAYPSISITAEKQNNGYTLQIFHTFDRFQAHLGDIKLDRDRDPKIIIDPNVWLAQQIHQSSLLQKQLNEKDNELMEAKVQIERLNNQMAEFVSQKENDETVLLQKLTVLLNSKKQKIHELQSKLNQENINNNNNNDPDKKDEPPSTPTAGKRNSKCKQKRQVDETSDIEEPATPSFKSSVSKEIRKRNGMSAKNTQSSRRLVGHLASSPLKSSSSRAKAEYSTEEEITDSEIVEQTSSE